MSFPLLGLGFCLAFLFSLLVGLLGLLGFGFGLGGLFNRLLDLGHARERVLDRQCAGFGFHCSPCWGLGP